MHLILSIPSLAVPGALELATLAAWPQRKRPLNSLNLMIFHVEPVQMKDHQMVFFGIGTVKLPKQEFTRGIIKKSGTMLCCSLRLAMSCFQILRGFRAYCQHLKNLGLLERVSGLLKRVYPSMSCPANQSVLLRLW